MPSPPLSLLNLDVRLCPLSLDCHRSGLMLTLPNVFFSSHLTFWWHLSVGRGFPVALLMAAPLVFLLLRSPTEPAAPSQSSLPTPALLAILKHGTSPGIALGAVSALALLWGASARPQLPHTLLHGGVASDVQGRWSRCPPPRPHCLCWRPHSSLQLSVFETVLLLPELAADPLLHHFPPSWCLAPSTSQAPSAQALDPR